MTRLARAALHYAACGWAVFPVHPRGKVPLTRRGCHDATADTERVQSWWRQAPQANIGIACGPSGLVVVDLDAPKGDRPAGADTFEDLQRRHGLPGHPLWARTGSGGWHAYYLQADGEPVGNSAGRLGPGIDVRGQGGYVVAPPSLHPCGGRYRWVTGGRPGVLPGWLARLARPPGPRTLVRGGPPPEIPGDVDAYGAAALRGEAQAVADTAPGGRNDRLNLAAFRLGQLAGAGALKAEQVEEALAQAAAACGLPAREAQRTIASGLEAGTAAPRKVAS